MNAKKDFIVGLFVLAAILILASATMMLRHWDLLNRRNTFFVYFSDVHLLDIGSPVLAYGVNVGTVSNLEYVGTPRPILVTIRIGKKVQLYDNAQIRVYAAQLLGNTTLIIDNTGSPGKTTHLLKPGDPNEALMGYEPHGMESMMNEAFQGLSKILNDADTQKAFKGTMLNLDSVTQRMDTTFKMINDQFVPLVRELKESSLNLNKLLTDARQAANRVADSVTSASEAFGGAASDYARAAKTLDREISDIAARIQKITDQLQQSVQSGKKPLGDTLDELRETSRSLRDVVGKIDRGEGTLGKLINDPRPFQNLQTLIDAISQRLTGGGGGQSAFPQVQEPSAGRKAGAARP